jgi:hypothetical protein
VTYGAAMTTSDVSQEPIMQVPVIPGWITSPQQGQGGPYIQATRIGSLTDFQRAKGCLSQFAAPTPEETERRCLAQWVLSELLDAARTAGDVEGATAAARDAYSTLLVRAGLAP